MEEEKDQRVYGAMDGAIRGDMFRQVQQRWMEWQKLFLSIIPFAEISGSSRSLCVVVGFRNTEDDDMAPAESSWLPTAMLLYPLWFTNSLLGGVTLSGSPFQ
jgi:hypothetical protein